MSVPKSTQQRSDPTQATEEWPRWRGWTIRIWYGLLSVWLLLMARGVVLVAMGKVDAGEHFLYTTVTVWKLLAVGGVLIICATAGRSVVAFQALVVGNLAWTFSEYLWAVPLADATPIGSGISSIVIWFVPLVALRPHRKDLLRLSTRTTVPLLVLAAGASVPWLVYAVLQGRLATDPNGSDAARDATTMAVVLAAQIAFAALLPRGTRWLPRVVTGATALVGLAAMLWPEDIASPGRAWGAALVVWSAGFAAVAEVRLQGRPGSRSTPPTDGHLTDEGPS